MRRLACIVVALTMACGGCAKRDPSTLFAPETGTIVVDAFLVVGQDFPPILLTQTLPANEPYSLVRAALHDAQVVIYDSTGAAPYAEDRDRPGIYYRQAGSLSRRVQAETVYGLAIRTADGRHVHGSTHTPASFYVPDWLLLDGSGTQIARHLGTFDVYGDSVFSRPENQLTYSYGLLEARFSPAGLVGIQVGLFSRTPNSPLIIDPDRYDAEDFARDNSSPPFTAREGNVRLPWFAIFYEGRYVIKIWSMDLNWFDFARTDPVLRGGGVGFGGPAGDNFERPIFHLEGGIGFFGSGSVDSIGVTIHPRPPAAR